MIPSDILKGTRAIFDDLSKKDEKLVGSVTSKPHFVRSTQSCIRYAKEERVVGATDDELCMVSGDDFSSVLLAALDLHQNKAQVSQLIFKLNKTYAEAKELIASLPHTLFDKTPLVRGSCVINLTPRGLQYYKPRLYLDFVAKVVDLVTESKEGSLSLSNLTHELAGDSSLNELYPSLDHFVTALPPDDFMVTRGIYGLCDEFTAISLTALGRDKYRTRGSARMQHTRSSGAPRPLSVRTGKDAKPFTDVVKKPTVTKDYAAAATDSSITSLTVAPVKPPPPPPMPSSNTLTDPYLHQGIGGGYGLHPQQYPGYARYWYECPPYAHWELYGVPYLSSYRFGY